MSKAAFICFMEVAPPSLRVPSIVVERIGLPKVPSLKCCSYTTNKLSNALSTSNSTSSTSYVPSTPTIRFKWPAYMPKGGLHPANPDYSTSMRDEVHAWFFDAAPPSLSDDPETRERIVNSILPDNAAYVFPYTTSPERLFLLAKWTCFAILVDDALDAAISKHDWTSVELNNESCKEKDYTAHKKTFAGFGKILDKMVYVRDKLELSRRDCMAEVSSLSLPILECAAAMYAEIFHHFSSTQIRRAVAVMRRFIRSIESEQDVSRKDAADGCFATWRNHRIEMGGMYMAYQLCEFALDVELTDVEWDDVKPLVDEMCLHSCLYNDMASFHKEVSDEGHPSEFRNSSYIGWVVQRTGCSVGDAFNQLVSMLVGVDEKIFALAGEYKAKYTAIGREDVARWIDACIIARAGNVAWSLKTSRYWGVQRRGVGLLPCGEYIRDALSTVIPKIIPQEGNPLTELSFEATWDRPIPLYGPRVISAITAP